MHGSEPTLVELPPAGHSGELAIDRPPRRPPGQKAEGACTRASRKVSTSVGWKRRDSVPPLDDSNAGYHAAPRLDPAVWQRILTHVRRTHPSLNRTWFETLVPRQLSNGVIHVTCETLSQLSFMTRSAQQPFTAAAQAVTNRLSVVMFHCEQIRAGGVFDDRDEPLALSPDYVFENFVTGPGNQLGYAAAVAVAEKPGAAYNPLFIHGGVGLGKTHLLQAICQHLLERRPEARILYLSCDAFISQFINAVEAGDMNKFRYKYRNADVLVVDDIHFFGGHERTQEEFFHTFNALQQSGRHIILSADAPPSQIPKLEERLVSRFNSGLVAPIERPCYDTRVAILHKKARMRCVELAGEVINYVAARIDRNTRELEGAVTKIQGLSLLTNRKIDMELAREALGDTGEAAADRRITVEGIIDTVTRYYGVKVSDLQSKRRNKSIAFPRQVCMYLAREHTSYSLAEIGGYFGGRDHTTVLHGVRTITDKMTQDAEVQRQVSSLANHIKGGV